MRQCSHSCLGEKAHEIRDAGGTEPKGRILLVDDDSVVQEVVSEMLVSLGYNVEIASSGRDALRIYKENSDDISLVVLDMIMPDMRGESVFRELQKTDPDVAVLIATGCNMDQQVLKMFEMGCRGFLQKPFHLKGLAEKISSILTSAKPLSPYQPTAWR